MNIIVITVLGALILLWGAILAIIKWIPDFGKNHLLGFGGYASVVCGVLLVLVIQTSITQQESALEKTRTRLNQELENFRLKLGEVQDRVMKQLQEKAELTEEEWKVRGNLQTEREQHERTRKDLSRAKQDVQQAQDRFSREASAHRAHVDSLNTEREMHRLVRERLAGEEQALTASSSALGQTRQALAAANQRLSTQDAQLTQMKTDLGSARRRAEAAVKTASVAEDQIQRTLTLQKGSIEILQASVDSIYRKVLKRPRTPLPAR